MKSWLKYLVSEPDRHPAAMDSCFPDLPVLKTEALELRPMLMRDARDIFAYASDPEVSRYVLWDPHRSLSDSREYVRYIRSLYRRRLPSSWAVVLLDRNIVIGSIGFMSFFPDHRKAEVGYSFSREYWNRGFATQALQAVIRWSFDTFPDLNRLEARHDIRNPASGRVMEKCGMRKEGVFRSSMVNKNECIDVAVYAILRSDLSA